MYADPSVFILRVSVSKQLSYKKLFYFCAKEEVAPPVRLASILFPKAPETVGALLLPDDDLGFALKNTDMCKHKI